MLDLGARRNLDGILSECGRLYRGYFFVFGAIALAVVLPLNLITQGLIEGQLTGDFDADNIASGGPAYSLVQTLITTPLITAGHVFAVMQVGRGETPRVGTSLANAGTVLPVLIGVVLLSTLAIIAGVLALIIPGIYISVKLLVAPQAAAAEESGGVIAALKRSWALTADNWWRVLGIYILLSLIAFIAGALLGLPVGALAAAADSGALLVIAQILADAVILSFTALGGTLLFFDLRARHDGAQAAPTSAAPPTPPPPDRPEAP